MIRVAAPLAVLAVALAGCASTPRAAAPTDQPTSRLNEAGLERVMNKSAAQLIQLFGDADLDQREGTTRRMQFVGPACVLDAYLSAEHAGAEPTVRYLDARLPGGDDIDRASCVAALSRRDKAP